ncbi:MAG TPA: class I SAM-dependent methyltransferase [Planctomycetota bacterium]|nr:class I SAM-dependent methyltransferase [Planctomycetota bacterium]
MLDDLRRGLWKIRQRFPLANNLYESVRGRKFPIYLEFPIHPAPRYGYTRPRHARIHALLERAEPIQRRHLESFLAFRRDFEAVPAHAAPERPEQPHWVNGTLPLLDAIALYGFIALNNPRRYVEIGSGNSTKFARAAIRRHGLKTTITSIDPHPRAEVDALCDEVKREVLEDQDLGIFSELRSGDVVFLDGSHCAFQNSDVTVFFLEVLPSLAEGVWVQIHDINWPRDYGPETVDRYFSEQYMLGAYLLGGGGNMEIQLANHYVFRDSELISIVEPMLAGLPELRGVERIGASFWFKIKASAAG